MFFINSSTPESVIDMPEFEGLGRLMLMISISAHVFACDWRVKIYRNRPIISLLLSLSVAVSAVIFQSPSVSILLVWTVLCHIGIYLSKTYLLHIKGRN